MTTSSEISVSATHSHAARLPAWLLPTATAAILALAYGPLLSTYFSQQWEQPHYQYFPFVIGAFAWLLWRNSALAEPRVGGISTPRRLGVAALLMGSWALLALAYYSRSPFLAVISAILLVAGGFLQIGARWYVPYLWGIWALLWLMVRIPLGRDQALISKLQHYSSRLSSLFLDLTGIEHLMDGNTLVLPNKQFFVDEACSGIVSVLSIIACAAIYGVWRNRPPLHVALLALAGVGWATLMNVLRITTIAVVYANWGIDWSTGASHEILGLVIFTLIFLALVSTDYLLLAVLEPIVPRDGDESVGTPIQMGAKIVAFWDWLQRCGAPRIDPAAAEAESNSRRSWELTSRLALGLVPLIAFGALASAQLMLPYWFGGGMAVASQSMDRAQSLDATALPENIEGLQRIGFTKQERTSDNVFGHFSRLYEYRDEHGNKYMLSCDYPFGPDWHELTACYMGIGWQLRERQVHSDPQSKQPPWNYVEARFTKPDGTAAWLVYGAFDEYGGRAEPPTGSLTSDLWRSIERNRLFSQTARLFQVQVWTTTAGPIREPQQELARKLLLHARDVLRQVVTQPASAVGAKAEPAPIRK